MEKAAAVQALAYLLAGRTVSWQILSHNTVPPSYIPTSYRQEEEGR